MQFPQAPAAPFPWAGPRLHSRPVPVALFALLLATAIAWVVASVAYTAWRVVRPPRMTEGKALYLLKRLSPEDLGLRHEPLGFDVRDGRGEQLKLVAWWIPSAAPADRTVVLLHGYGDAKIGAIAWAPTWHELGWNVVAVDGRAHGESGGRFCSGGYHERDDLDAIVDALRARYPTAARHVALFGVSLGTGAAVGCAARRGDISAVVLDSPFADYGNAVRSHLRRLRIPLTTLHGVIVRLAEKICGARWRDTRPAELIRRIKCPVLTIRGSADDFVTPGDLAALDAAMASREDGGRSRVVVVAGAHHTLALAADPVRYRNVIASFLAGTRDRASAAP